MELDTNKYQELIRNIEIKNINLKDLTVNHQSDTLQNNIEISAKQEISSFSRKSESLVVMASTSVQGYSEEKSVFSINFTLEINYSLNSKYEFEQEYFELFTENNVPVNVWPFARELVSSITTRMGYPPLVLPLLKV